jgi:hypothetical protein
MQNISNIDFSWMKSRDTFKKAAIVDTPGLFRNFSRLNSLDEIRVFADAYGERVTKNWAATIRRMRRAVSLWDKVKDSSGKREQRRALQLEIHRALADADTPSLVTVGLTPELRLALYPANLLGYMWLTFARIVSGEIEERPCKMFERCQGYIYVGQGLGLQRADTETCGPACRKKKSRA